MRKGQKIVSDAKKLKQVKLQFLSYDYFCGTLDEVIGVLTVLKEDHSGFEELSIRCEAAYDYVDFTLVGKRLETDAEFEKRLKAEREHAEAKRRRNEKQEKKEKAQLRKLLDKYGAV